MTAPLPVMPRPGRVVGKAVYWIPAAATNSQAPAANDVAPRCPRCGGDEDPCPKCHAAALSPELAEDLLWAVQFDRVGLRHHIRYADTWLIDGGPELVRRGLLERRVNTVSLTPLGCDVVRVLEAR